MYEEIIKKHLPYFENRTAKNWDAELLLKEFVEDIKASNADGGNRQVDAVVINFLPDLLRECHELIQQGIYSEDGIDGGDGQKLLDKIEQHIKVERSHRDVTGLPET